jgi:lysophospholipase L1-like esterase
MMGTGMRKDPIRIVFLGDSITAGTRNVNDGKDLGAGYPKYVSENLSSRFPSLSFDFFNRGIWGNETKDVIGRLQTDALDLKPDLLVLFVGVNDTLRHAESEDLSKAQFEAQYEKILTEIKTTNAKILVIEPYLLMEDVYHRSLKRFDLVERIDSIRKLAKKYADGYMPLDGMFARLYVTENVSEYTVDGLHPNEKGARFIGDACAQYIEPILKNMLGE